MTDTDDDREVDFVLVEPDDDPDATAETGFVLVEDTELVPVEDAGADAEGDTDRPAVVRDAETGFVVHDPDTEETGFVLVEDAESVAHADLVPVRDPTRNYPAVIEDVETDFVLVENDGDAVTDFVLVDDADVDVDRESSLVPVDPDEYALRSPSVDPKRNGHH